MQGNLNLFYQISISMLNVQPGSSDGIEEYTTSVIGVINKCIDDINKSISDVGPSVTVRTEAMDYRQHPH